MVYIEVTKKTKMLPFGKLRVTNDVYIDTIHYYELPFGKLRVINKRCMDTKCYWDFPSSSSGLRMRGIIDVKYKWITLGDTPK